MVKVEVETQDGRDLKVDLFTYLSTVFMAVI